MIKSVMLPPVYLKRTVDSSCYMHWYICMNIQVLQIIAVYLSKLLCYSYIK